MEKFNEEFSTELQEKINSFVSSNENVKTLQTELLSIYFGKSWIEKIKDLIIETSNLESISKIYNEYDSKGINTNLIPDKKEDIFKRFRNVPFNKIKAVLLSDKPGIIEKILETDNLDFLEKQGVFILTHELTTSKDGLHDGKAWRSFTTEIHGLLIDFDVIEVTKNMNKDQLIESLKLENITWQE